MKGLLYQEEALYVPDHHHQRQWNTCGEEREYCRHTKTATGLLGFPTFGALFPRSGPSFFTGRCMWREMSDSCACRGGGLLSFDDR
jgi:hypothetical protein